jgi:DNA-binding GntR family transcriptional regulator
MNQTPPTPTSPRDRARDIGAPLQLRADSVTRAPLYWQVAAVLREHLCSGHYRAGDQLPSAGALTEMFHVSRPTVRQALALLRAENLIEVVNGKGNFALDLPPHSSASTSDETSRTPGPSPEPLLRSGR